MFFSFASVAITFSYLYDGRSFWEGYSPSGDMNFWCERDSETMFVRERSNSWSDLSYLFVGLTMLFVGTADYLYGGSPINSSRVSQQTAARTPFFNLFKEYPSLTIISGLVNIVHASGTFANHACRCWVGYQFDVTGMYLVTLGILCYDVLRIFKIRPYPIPLCVYLALGAACFGSTYTHIDPAFIMIPIIVGIGILARWYYIVASRRGAILHGKIFVAAMAFMGLGYLSWNLDKHRIVCNPDSFFQLHAVWHVFTAAAIILIFVYSRMENYAHISHIWKEWSRNDQSVEGGETLLE